MKNVTKVSLISMILVSILMSGCEKKMPSIESAVAVIYPTEGRKVFGKVTFSPEKEGVKVAVLLYNLSPGEHGFHIHEYGDCSSGDGSAAGAHFNPSGKPHNGPSTSKRHVGDLGNVLANENGIAVLQYYDANLKLNGPNGVIGRAVIVHERSDDFKTQPSGDAGARLGCGVIGIAK